MKTLAKNSISKARYYTLKFIRTTLFGADDKLTDNEMKNVQQKFEKNKISVKLEFDDIVEERATGLEDIKLYLPDEKEKDNLFKSNLRVNLLNNIFT